MAITPEEAAQRLRDTGRFRNFVEDLLRVGGRLIGERTVNRFMRDTGPDVPARNPISGRGSLRIQTARLARSYVQTRGRLSGTGGAGESIVEIEVTAAGGRLRKGSRVPYAAVHEFGFRGVQQVPAHTRTITQAFGRPLEQPQEVQVSAHRRAMRIEARPHLRPGLNAARQAVAQRSRQTLAALVDEQIIQS